MIEIPLKISIFEVYSAKNESKTVCPHRESLIKLGIIYENMIVDKF